MNKVSRVNLVFWIMKICATTLGETAGDLLSMTLNFGYALSSAILVGLFLGSLVAQLAAGEFHPVLFWTVVLTTSTAGTTMSDYMDRTLGVGYAAGSLILLGILALVLAAWRFFEKSISVSNVQSRRVELFYWAAILASNTLGTAFGDYLADDSGLGFLGGASLIASLLTLVVLTMRLTRINRVILFWIAFVLTRPFGATFGDLLTKPAEHGGLAFGTIGSSAILFALLTGLVVHTSACHRRMQAQATLDGGR